MRSAQLTARLLRQARARLNEEEQRLRQQARSPQRRYRPGLVPVTDPRDASDLGSCRPEPACCWPPSLSESRLIQCLTARSSSWSVLGPAGSRSLKAWYWSGRRGLNPRGAKPGTASRYCLEEDRGRSHRLQCRTWLKKPLLLQRSTARPSARPPFPWRAPVRGGRMHRRFARTDKYGQ